MTDLITWIIDKAVDGILYTLKVLFDALQQVGHTAIKSILDVVLPMIPNWNPASVWTYIDLGNYYVPLEESIGMFVTAFSLWAAVWAYRLLKSWVPFLGS